MSTWLGLSIGNSRYHWAEFSNHQMLRSWETEHLSEPFLNSSQKDWGDLLRSLNCIPTDQAPLPELWLASVVPAQTELWQTYPHLHRITLADIPIPDMYPSLGIDRALALWGAGSLWGWPVLVIDGGTALTFTGVDDRGVFKGGAILPGLGLQGRSLTQFTAALPQLDPLATTLPPRWATDTLAAMHSGILYTLLAGLDAFITDWWKQFPDSALVFTGGDGNRLATALQSCLVGSERDWLKKLQVNPHLVLQGIAALRSAGRSAKVSGGR